ncbi:ATP-binding protein [Coleofasciculus sp. FACHB-712]|uniref:ATP-binding protein n=1 Tax=Coleofasciculus sp. FACHB-712 TaxID=2692789 RepID=UPI001681E3A5|nr:ATP-binding protein [Coleofasciculus sp. FACHB-712]MBD1942121.1 ATP-binding protein [Coleofasciculus sp. FACHB-712]
MNSEDAFYFINELFLKARQSSLNECEKDVICGTWEGKTYQKISDEKHRDFQYVKETGSALFNKLSQLLRISIKKNNFKPTIEQLWKQQSIKVLSSSEPLLLANREESEQTSISQPNKNFVQHQNSITNPFFPQQGRVDDVQQFFNRDREIRRVFEVLDSGSSVALIGEEGIGKSSLLWKICQLAESRLHSPRQAVFLDLNLVHDENDFYCALCHEVGIPESNGYSLTRNLRDRRILLAIDNVGKMTWEGFTRGVRDRLRGLAEGGNAPLKLILAASEPLDSLFNDSQDEGKTSPLAGICQEENLRPWDEANARAFIEARLAVSSVRFTQEEIIQLVQESDGHPRRLMQLCYQAYVRYIEGGE